ncbi:tyrosine-type recombinase/integrase [Peribacillus castrilensis]|uniref:tyrosine-type recombinase/integrase n=1 Tax=Peribacillus TaxID=2675229 RepID=UPI003B8CEB17
MLLLEDVIEEYLYHCITKGYTKKTLINKRQEYKQLKLYLKEKRAITELESITLHDLKAYVRGKQQSGLKPQSIESMAKMVSAFFSWCVKEEYIKENPMKKVETPKVQKLVLKGFTLDEVTAMINAFTYKNYISARNRCIIAMMADCGLRAMEIRGLKITNVHETSILVNGKGNKERIVFISPALKKILIKYARMRKDHFKHKIITDNYFLSYKGSEISHVGLYNVIKKAGKIAGIEDKRVSPHTFRHFYSVQCLIAGIDVYSLSRLLGHSEITTTERYLRSLNDEQLLDKAVSSSPLMNMVRNKL